MSATRTLENALRRQGFDRVCGVDEVGRGCLAGPVVAGAVVLHPDHHISYLSDSKQVPPAEREELFEAITSRALAWAVAEASPSEIDAINIHQASLQAMRRAVLAIAPAPDVVLVDAFRIPGLGHDATWNPAWRSSVRSDCGGIHHREGHQGPADATVAHPGPSLRIRST